MRLIPPLLLLACLIEGCTHRVSSAEGACVPFGWGGRYEVGRPEGEARAIWTDAADTVLAPDGNRYTSNWATVWRWREAYQADFAARMDWPVEPAFHAANHEPIAVVNGDATGRPIFIRVTSGERVDLSAAGSSDPEGGALRGRWWFYLEAGNAPTEVEIESSKNASLVVPAVAPGSEFHVILQVEDDGEPSLRSYRRVVINAVGDNRGAITSTRARRHTPRAAAQDGDSWPDEVVAEVGRAAARAGSSALAVVHRGFKVLEWGDTSKRFNGHSIRKSLLSALIGIAVDRGLLDIDRSVGSFALPEGEELNAIERSATVRQLLMSRSGIYLPAANETPMTMWRRPRRNAYAPGEHWYYNNWDFNALGVIFEKSSGLGIGEAFHRWIAGPIGMKDFRPQDVTYESWLGSRHPAYPFWITARNLATFGWLLAREGRGSDGQVISKEWKRASTQPYSDTGASGYGFMWWVENGGRLYLPDLEVPFGSFMGLGLGGQYLVVVPECGLVVANLVDTGESKLERLAWLTLGDSVEPDEFASLLRTIFDQAGCAGG